MATIANKGYLTSSNLISSIKRRASIPDTQDMITDNEILEFANEEMLLNFIPLVYSRHEDYYLVRQEIPLEAGVVRYPIPYRSIATKVREVALKNANGDLREMFRISVDEVTNSYREGTSYVHRYYFEGEEIVLHVNKSSFNPSDLTLVIFYNLRPNSLVDSDRVGIITSIEASSTLSDVTNIFFNPRPDNLEAGTEVDFIKSKSPHRVLTYDKVIQEAGGIGADLYIAIKNEDLPSRLVVGDRVASAGETDIVNAPSDLHVMLAQMVAERVLESIGDQSGLQAAGAKLAKMEKNSALVLDNRSIGSPIKANPRNGTIRQSGLGRKRRRYSTD